MTTAMPKDSSGVSMPILGMKPAGAQKITIGASSTRNSVAFGGDTKAVTIYAEGNCYIEQGDETVTASTSSHYIPAGTSRDISILDSNETKLTHIAVIQDGSSTGTFFISERQ